MADPKGNLTTPTAFRADGSLHAYELDDSDHLKVHVADQTADVEVVQQEPADLRAGINGWFSAAWQKAPLPFGPSGIVLRSWDNTNIAAGSSSQTDGDVPAGELWVITSTTFRYVGTSPTTCRMRVRKNSAIYTIYGKVSPVSDESYSAQTWIVMEEGDKLQLRIIGGTAGDDIYCSALGFSIDIDQ